MLWETFVFYTFHDVQVRKKNNFSKRNKVKMTKTNVCLFVCWKNVIFNFVQLSIFVYKSSSSSSLSFINENNLLESSNDNYYHKFFFHLEFELSITEKKTIIKWRLILIRKRKIDRERVKNFGCAIWMFLR